MRQMLAFVSVAAVVGCGGNAASPSAQAPAPAPPVASAAPHKVVNGWLEPALIQRTVRASFARFRICYEDALRRDPNLRGLVTVKFVIDRVGRVAAVRDAGSTMPDASVVECVLHGFRELSFPKPDGGMVTVVYPINFEPADDAPDGGARQLQTGYCRGMKLPMDGGCRCDRVRIRVTRAPMITLACHCPGCQRMSSSAFSLTAMFLAGAFEVTKGDPVIGGLHGPDAHHFFCAYCMTWMFTRAAIVPHIVNVRPTMFDDRAWFAPFVESYTKTKLPWAVTGAVHSFEEFPPMESYGELVKEFAAREAAKAASSQGLGRSAAVKKPAVHGKNVFAAKPGPVTGTVKLTAEVVSRRAAYEWQSSIDGKTWVDLPGTLQANTAVMGLLPGATVSFRYRALTRTGEGDWSLPTSITVR